MILFPEDSNTEKKLAAALAIASGSDAGQETDAQQRWIPNIWDIIISTLLVALLPMICYYSFDWTGALLPLILYYTCCWYIVYLRQRAFKTYPYNKYTFGYHYNYTFFKETYAEKWYIWSFTMFAFFLLFIRSYQQSVLIIKADDEYWGLTLIFWVPVNAFSEQLLWFYILDSFWNYKVNNKWLQYSFMILGFIMSSTFNFLIHFLFWDEFFYEFDDKPKAWSDLAVPIINLVGISWMILWKLTDDMTVVAFIHLILNGAGVIIAKWSLSPIFK